MAPKASFGVCFADMVTLCVAMITLTVPIFILSIVSFTLTRVCCCPKYPPGRYPSCLSHPSHSRNRIANSCLFHIHHATRSGALPTRFPALMHDLVLEQTDIHLLPWRPTKWYCGKEEGRRKK